MFQFWYWRSKKIVFPILHTSLHPTGAAGQVDGGPAGGVQGELAEPDDLVMTWPGVGRAVAGWDYQVNPSDIVYEVLESTTDIPDKEDTEDDENGEKNNAANTNNQPWVRGG